MNMIEIGTRRIGPGYPCFIIAEIGTGHGGSLKRAEEIVHAARESGADCVKLQAVFADEILHPRTGDVELPGGKVDLYAKFMELEQDPSFYASVKKTAESIGLVFLCTPFGLRSARLLKDIGVRAIKIASPETNHFPLLQEVAEYRVPVIASTGVTTAGDIERMLSVLGRNTALLHCVTSYPAPETEYNIRIIPNLTRFFGVVAGVSDHSLDPVLVPLLSVISGGSIIEKHFALDKGGAGLDDPIALVPKEFKSMVESIRKAESEGTEAAFKSAKVLFGEKKVSDVLGTGVKELPPSEIKNYPTTRRSVLALTDIEEGEFFTEQNTALLRSEKNLRPGLRPEFHHLILGKPAKRRIRSGYGVTWDDVI